jgi:hypothetical protein
VFRSPPNLVLFESSRSLPSKVNLQAQHQRGKRFHTVHSSTDHSFSGPPISLADFSSGTDFNPNVADMALGISTTAGLFQTWVTCAPLGPGLCSRLNLEHRENRLPNGGVVSGSVSRERSGMSTIFGFYRYHLGADSSSATANPLAHR